MSYFDWQKPPAGAGWLAGGISGYNANRGSWFAPTPASWTYTPPVGGPTITNISPPTPAIVTGIEPQAYEAILYGKDIPLFVGGKALIGGRVIEGPFFGGTQADPTVSFIAYHAYNIVGELFSSTQITSARLRGQEVWNADDGYIATDKAPSGSFDWNPGHVQNHAHAQSIGRYGSNAVPYTYGITSSWENIPLKPFGGIVPFPSVMVESFAYGDPLDGITRNQAISNILSYMNVQSYEVDVSGSDPAWLIANNMSLTEFLGQLRAIFINYHITYSDRLRIIEPDTFTIVGELTNNNVLRDSLMFKRTDPMSLPREKRYTYIDVDRDYEPNTALAKEDRFPTPTTDATGSVSIELPIITTAAQAVADIHNSLYDELKARSQMSGVVDETLFGLECADGVRFADSPIIDITARVMETVHDFASWTVQFKASEVIHCLPNLDEDFAYVALLMGFDGTNGSVGFVDESSAHRPLTYSGGAVIDTAASVFGGSSLKAYGNFFTGTDDGVSLVSIDPDLDLRSKWTAECRVNFHETTTGSGDRAIFGSWNPPSSGYLLRWYNGNLDWFCYNGTNLSYGWTPSIGQWYAVTLDFDGTTLRMYIDGEKVAEVDGMQAGVADALTFAVGLQSGSGGGRPFNGHIDEFRFTNGINRYGGDTYTLATTKFPRVGP